MKHVLIIVALFIAAGATTAQEQETRVKEAGITFRSFDNFGVTYRIGNSEALWRFNTAYLEGSQTDLLASIDYSGNTTRNIGVGMNVGREFRKTINEHFEFRSGTDFTFQFRRNESKPVASLINNVGNSTRQDYYIVGVNFVLGANYIFNNSLVVGVEILPSITYNLQEVKQETTSYDGTSYSTETTEYRTGAYVFGLQNQFAMLSIVYRY